MQNEITITRLGELNSIWGYAAVSFGISLLVLYGYFRYQQGTDSQGAASPASPQSLEDNTLATGQTAQLARGQEQRKFVGISFGEVGPALPGAPDEDVREDWRERQRRDFYNYAEQVQSLSLNRESSGSEQVENRGQDSTAYDPYEVLRSTSLAPTQDKEARARYRWERFGSYMENAARSQSYRQPDGG